MTTKQADLALAVAGQMADQTANAGEKPRDNAAILGGLADDDKKKLTKLEREVFRLQRSFIGLIDTLAKIAEVLAGYPGFRMAAYVRDVFDIDSVTWSRYQDAENVFAALREAFVSEADLPRNEGQCRELAKILKKKGKGELVTVWKQLMVSGQKITADAIKQYGSEAQTGESRSQRQVTPLQSLKSVESLAKESGQKTYVSVVARCSSDEAQDLMKSISCKTTEKDGVHTFDEFRVEDLEETLVKMAAWVGRHPINALQLNIVRS